MEQLARRLEGRPGDMVNFGYSSFFKNTRGQRVGIFLSFFIAFFGGHHQPFDTPGGPIVQAAAHGAVAAAVVDDPLTG
jgi:hypothetical protein